MSKLFSRSLLGIFLLGAMNVSADEYLMAPPCERCASGCGIYLSIDYLYWKFQQEQLYFVGANAMHSPFGSLKMLEQDIAFISGFRAEMGYDLPFENFDIYLNWTRFRVHQTTTYVAEGDQFAIAIGVEGYTNVGDVPSAQAARAKWHLGFDILDIGLGSTYLVGSRLAVRPLLGVRGGWINQSQNILYSGTEVNPGEFENTSVMLKNNYRGVGPLMGVDMRWDFFSHFGLFTTFSGALLYGHFDVNTTIYVPSVIQTNLLNIDNSRNGVVPEVQIEIGIDRMFCLCNEWMLRLGIAYEMQCWWNMMRANSNLSNALFVNYRGGGDLTSIGLTVKAGMDF